jgi:putative Mg2+ transporter-C (MgtC) family protein
MRLISDWSMVATRLGVATLLGSLIGLNRNLHHKPAGVRTHSLVALGSALFLLVSTGGDDLAANGGSAVRTIQGIVAGIGFLGAGVILQGEGRHAIHGLTTASAIWLTAGLGVACGAGYYVPAAVATGFALFVLIVGGPLEDRATRHFNSGSKSTVPSPPARPGTGE